MRTKKQVKQDNLQARRREIEKRRETREFEASEKKKIQRQKDNIQRTRFFNF